MSLSISINSDMSRVMACNLKYTNLYAGSTKELIETYNYIQNTNEDAQFDSYVVYTNCYVNFRTGPSVEFEVIQTLSPNTMVTVIGVDHGWCNIILNDQEGYIKSNYLSKDVTPVSELNRWGISLTDDEIYLLANIVNLEAGIDTLTGKEAVIESIFNRMTFSRSFSGDLYSVLSSPGQYSTWSYHNNGTPGEEEYRAIKNVLYGTTYILEPSYVYFSREKSNGHDFVKIGMHWFGKE